MAKRVPITIQRDYTIHVMERSLVHGMPGSAEPSHSFRRLFTTRANVQTRGGVAEIAQVTIKGEQVTHTFAIRYTTIAFDAQNYVRDARGQLYRILSVENKNLADRELLIHCASQGADDVEAAR